MKRLLAVLLTIFCVTLSIPYSLSASDSSKVINKHGSKTYIGTSSDWESRWDSDHFEDITGQDVSTDGNLTIKGGSVGNVDVSGSGSTLTVTGGTMKSISCDSDITISGGTVNGSVASNSGTLEFSGSASITGDVQCSDLSVSGSSKQSISGKITCSEQASLYGSGLKWNKILCDTLRLEHYRGSLGDVTATTVCVESGSSITANRDMDIMTLRINDGCAMKSTGTLKVDYLYGPGSLITDLGKLSVFSSVSNIPLYFSSAEEGAVAFTSSASLDMDQISVYGYALSCKESGSEYQYILNKQSGSGVSLSQNTVALADYDGKQVRASARPSLSQLPSGSKICWVFSDPTCFTYSLNSNNTVCTVQYNGSSSVTSASTFLACYLVDKNGDRLNEDTDGICRVTYSKGAAVLDTSAVNIPLGCTYNVLDKSAGSSYDSCSSGNSSVVSVGTPVKTSGGWLYPLTAKGKGTASVTIGNTVVSVSVTHGCGIVDTSSLTLGIGGTYTIGIALHGITDRDIKETVTNGSVSVAYKGTSNGTALYTVNGLKAGTTEIVFTGASGSAKTAVTVKPKSARSGIWGKLKVLV